MTEHENDPLYDALRDRLTDYGQEPPAPLWASIRAQLPPVAGPQLRLRSRNRVAWLALLLLLGTGSWGVWHLVQPNGTARSGMNNRSVRPVRVAAEGITVGVPVGAASQSSAPANQFPARPEAAQSRPALVAEANRTSAEAGRPAMDSPGVPTPNALAASSSGGMQAAPMPASPSPVHTARGRSIRARAPETIALQLSARARGLPRVGVHPPAHLANGVANAAFLSATPTASAKPKLEGRPAAAAFGHGDPNAVLLATMPPATATRRNQSSPSKAGSDAAAVGPYVVSPAPPGTEQPAEWTQLARRRVQPTTTRWPAMAVHERTDSLPALPQPNRRRWALQAVSGPTLAYRVLHSQLTAASLPASSNTGFSRFQSATDTTQEQPDIAFGAEVQARYVLTGRWSASAGLGYHEYATNQVVVVTTRRAPAVFTQIPQPDSLTISSTRVRSTYRFITVPLRLSYQLGPGSSRLRYGLLAGADVALCLGSSSAGGGTGPPRSSDMPYRTLSLALGLGAEVRYRLAPRWDVLAQPTATLFITSVVRPSSGDALRYPVAAGGLVGLAYWLR